MCTKAGKPAYRYTAAGLPAAAAQEQQIDWLKNTFFCRRKEKTMEAKLIYEVPKISIVYVFPEEPITRSGKDTGDWDVHGQQW